MTVPEVVPYKHTNPIHSTWNEDTAQQQHVYFSAQPEEYLYIYFIVDQLRRLEKLLFTSFTHPVTR